MEAANDGVSSVGRKYLAGRCNPHTTSIMDYIHLSSKLLRSVRHGQPLEIAVNPRVTSHRSPPRIQAATEKDYTSMSRLGPFEPPRSVRGVDKILLSPKSRAVPLAMESTRRWPASASFLRFGRTVRFVADDGCLLLIDSDGSAKKVPATLDVDLRTLLTVFPSDPLAVGAASKCVRAGEGVFLAQGVAAVYDAHSVVHADARKMRVRAMPEARGDKPLGTMDESDAEQASKRTTTVWTLSKVVDASSLTVGRSMDAKATLRSLDDEYFPNGASLEIRHGGRVVCYELIEPESARSSSAASTSASEPGIHGDAHASSPLAAVPVNDLWLAEAHWSDGSDPSALDDRRPAVATRWRLVDVVVERKQQERRRLLAASKLRLDRRLGTPSAKRLASADATLASTRPHAGAVSSDQTQKARQLESEELEERLNRAARIIVRFLRRICIDEAAKKRISGLAQRKRRELRRLTLTVIGSRDNQHSGLTVDEQLCILRCYKPAVYASSPLLMPPLNTSPQKAAAMRQLQRNRDRSRNEKSERISHELAFLRGNHVATVLQARPATTKSRRANKGSVACGKTHVEHT